MAQQDIASLLQLLIEDETINGISTTAGSNKTQTKKAVGTALPQLIQALSKNSKSEEGANSLFKALDDHDGSALDDILGTINDSNTQTDGAKILGHILGGDESSVVQQIASKAGISSSQASGILQTLSPLVLETLGKAKNTQGLNASDISEVLSRLLNGSGSGGGSFLIALLDQDKDGDYKDDLLAMFINWLKKLFFGR